MEVVNVIAWAVAGYVTGSIPVAYLLARTRGVNILEVGTGNPGTMNVFRTIGKRFGVLEFFLDATKGAAPVLVASLTGTSSPWLYLVAASAVLGHWFPLFLRLRGGIGIATGAGVAFAVAPSPGAVAIGLGAAVRLVWHNTSGAAGIGAAAFLVGAFWQGMWGAGCAVLVLAGAIGLRAFVMERDH